MTRVQPPLQQYPMKELLLLDGYNLSPHQLHQLSIGILGLDLTVDAWQSVTASRAIIDDIVSKGRVAYGINTGFGLFSDVVIEEDKLEQLQLNLIRSHASGVGEPLTQGRTRMLLALRINVLARGHSGVRPETVCKMINAFNKDCLSVVPCQGTVGASGDLAQLSHLCLGLLGEGLMWQGDRRIPANEALASNGLEPIVLGAKEGLALINGTQMITSLGAEAVVRADNLLKCADVACAMTLESLKGTVNAFHPRIHLARPHAGQNLVACRLRALLDPEHPSELFNSHKYSGKVQDAYTLRCTPQVHGIVEDTLRFVEGIITCEMNSSTDNPMVFLGPPSFYPGVEPGSPRPRHMSLNEQSGISSNLDDITDLEEAKREIARMRLLLSNGGARAKSGLFSSTLLKTSGGFVISGGNFHGEYPSKALDFLAIAVGEISNISERRIERLVNPQLSGLPAFLVKNGGLNSGFMIAHCTAAALTSENKTLSHPASSDSISTSAAKEDHVSMGGFAARKCLQVIENVERVVAIELLCACQAIEFHRPLRTSAALEAVHALVRAAGVDRYDEDRFMAPDIDTVTRLITSGQVWKCVEPYLKSYTLAVNDPLDPLTSPTALQMQQASYLYD